jgi:signal transduction histidine kinase
VCYPLRMPSTTDVRGPTAARPSPPTEGAVRLLRILRWMLPLLLCLIGVYAEWSEHIAGEHESITPYLVGEVLVFAIAGPVAVWFTLSWVVRLVAAYQATDEALRLANRDLEGAVRERTAHLREATEQLQAANTELARANEDLRQLDRMKSEFVSLVSHQLRAPVTNINGALEIVAQDTALLPASSQRTLQILVQESQRLSHLIQTILDVSRLEAGRLPVHLGPVALEPLLARTAAATLGDGAPARWQVDVTPGMPPAWADELLLEEVVRNLLENASRYAPVGLPIVIAARHGGAGLEVSVADRGPGVPPEEQARIFQSFHRVGDVETTVSGYGLGLYFADRLVRALHGTIGVDSPLYPGTPEPGARFWFSVPIAHAGPGEEEDVPWPDGPETAAS